jgi:hypothetical protein
MAERRDVNEQLVKAVEEGNERAVGILMKYKGDPKKEKEMTSNRCRKTTLADPDNRNAFSQGWLLKVFTIQTWAASRVI